MLVQKFSIYYLHTSSPILDIMIRFASIALILLGFVQIIDAQKPVVKISPEFKLPKSKSFTSHLYSDTSGHYVYFYDVDRSTWGGDYSPVLEKYDPNFKLLFSKEYGADRKGISSLGMRYFNGQFLWLFSETNKKDDYICYSFMPIDLKGKLGKANDIAKFKYEKRSDKPTIFWNTSKDSTKLLFRAVSDHDDKEDNFGLFLSVMDENMNVSWSRKYSLDYTEEQVTVLATLLKNDGSVYLLAKVYEGNRAKESKKNDKRKSVAAYEMKLFHFTKADETAREYQLRMGDSYIRGASLATDKNDNLKCAGFYSNTKNGSIQGVFYLQLGLDGSITASSKKEFSIEDLKKFGEKNTDKDRTGDVGLEESFKFSEFKVRDDGSAVVVAEENYVVETIRYNERPNYRTSYTTTYRYYSKDIIILTINTQGEIERVSAIPKLQMGVNTKYFISYVSMIHGDDVVFFYNEDKDNMEKPVNNPKPKMVNNFNECITVMTTLTPDGELTRKQLFGTKDVASLFVPDDSSAFGNNSLFFVSIKPRLFGKTNFYMGTVTLPD